MTAETIFDKKNVLVAGGAGFIGSHVCDRLIKDHKVICVDNFISGQETNIDHLLANPNFIFIRHDLIQPIDLDKFPELKKFKVDAQGIQEIYNLACPSSTKHYEKFLIETILANSHVTRNLLEIAVKYKSKFLQASTSAVYGSPLEGQRTFEESYWGFIDPIGPRSSYNEGKRFAESLVANYRAKYNSEFKIARIFNTYGPRMKLDSGRMIPDFVNAALNNLDLEVYGQGEDISSYCYISDLIDGLTKFMDSAELGPMNLGNPDIYTIKEIVTRIIELTNSNSKINYLEKIPFLLKQSTPDIGLAKEKIGWFPVTRLEDGLKKTIEDMQGARVLTYQQESTDNNKPNNNKQ